MQKGSDGARSSHDPGEILFFNEARTRRKQKSHSRPGFTTEIQRHSCAAALFKVLIVMCGWIFAEANFAPPPHLLACPGPRDNGDINFCNRDAGVMAFEQREVSVRLDAGVVTLWLLRDGGAAGPFESNFTTVGNNASDMKFQPKSGPVRWGTYDSAPKAISIALIPNSNSSTSYLSSLTVIAQAVRPAGQIAQATVSIIDTRLQTGKINFASLDAITVTETVGSIEIKVTRSNGYKCQATVWFRTLPYPGFDYGNYGGTARNFGNVTWADGENGNRSFTIDIIADAAIHDPPEQFYIQLFNIGCAPLAPAYRPLVVTVLDSDLPGVLEIEPKHLVVVSGYQPTTATLTVNRLDGAAGAVTVEYMTEGQSAIAGVHFQQASGVLMWDHLDSSPKYITINIPAASATDLSPQTYLNVVLQYVTGTSVFGQGYATIAIENSLVVRGIVGFQQELACLPPAPAGNCLYVLEGSNRDAEVVALRSRGSAGILSITYQIDATNMSMLLEVMTVAELTGTLTWNDRDTSPKTIILPFSRILDPNDNIWHYVRITLQDDSGSVKSAIDANSSEIIVVFVNPDSGGNFTISSLNVTVSQKAAGRALFAIHRGGLAHGSAVVTYQTITGDFAQNQIACEGPDCNMCVGLSPIYQGRNCNLSFAPFLNAQPGRDFVFTEGNISWDALETGYKFISVEILDDYTYSFGNYFKYFSVRLMTASGPFLHTFAIDPNYQQAVTCISDDDAATGYLLFPQTEYDVLTGNLINHPAKFSVIEGNLSLQLKVMRKKGMQGNLTIEFSTVQSTDICADLVCAAVPGRHFVPTAGKFVWYEGDQSDRLINVTILRDPSWNSSVAFLEFMVALENVTFFNGRQTARSYTGPQTVLAQINIQEADGPGIASFQTLSHSVREDSGSVVLDVKRLGGSTGNISIAFTTRQGSAESPISDASGQIAAFPQDCSNATTSGVYRIQTVSGVREVFCNVIAGDIWRSCSIFLWDGFSKSLWDRECTHASASGGFVMWQDFASMLSAETGQVPMNGGHWQHAQQETDSVPLIRPGGVGNDARAVSFPVNNVTIWFDWVNRSISWTYGSTDFNVSFTSVGIAGNGGMNSSLNDFYFITDGVNMVHVGKINVTSFVLPSSNIVETPGSIGMYGPSAHSISQNTSGWQVLSQKNQDDAYLRLPDLGFDFIFKGINYRLSTFIGSNAYITFGSGSKEYANLSTFNPPVPTLHFGSADNSWQLIAFRKVYEGTSAAAVVRFEGTAATSGILGSPDILAEITIFSDGRIRLIKSLHAKAYDSLFFLSDGGMYSDGVGVVLGAFSLLQNSTVIIQTYESRSAGLASLLRFNWQTGAISSRQVPALQMDKDSVCKIVDSAYGHVLWTVNGRVMYRDCSFTTDVTHLHMILGGTMQDPNSARDRIAFSKCPDSNFEKCKNWNIDSSQHGNGLGVFSNVDSYGYLYFGDFSRIRGTNLLQCGSKQFAAVRTNIELGQLVVNDFSPVSGTINWTNGDNSTKHIQVTIANDGVPDSMEIEVFTVDISGADSSSVIDNNRKTAAVEILDLEGPGLINISLNPAYPSPLSERGFCCQECASVITEDTRFCSYYLVNRSSPRGVVCADLVTVGGSENITYLTAIANVDFVPGNTTVCWGHEDVSIRNLSVFLKPNLGYNHLFKSFNLSLQPILDNPGLTTANVNGSNYLSVYSNGVANVSSNHGASLSDPATQILYDIDARVGLFSFDADASSGDTIFSVAYEDSSALLLVERFDGLDTDISVEYSTEVYNGSFKSSGEIPITMTAPDGSSGENVFCTVSQFKDGTCQDSSSNLQCDPVSGLCTFRFTVVAGAGVPGNGFDLTAQQSASPPSDYFPAQGVLEWKEGDRNPKGVSVPVFFPVHVSNPNQTSPYRAFVVVLSNLLSSKWYNGGRVMNPIAAELPARHYNEGCELCSENNYMRSNPIFPDIGFCRFEVCTCDAWRCRNSSTSSSLVVMPILYDFPGFFRIVNTTYFIPENIRLGSVKFFVQRFGGSSGPVSVRYSVHGKEVLNLSVAALEGSEVIYPQGSVSWSDGDLSIKEIIVSIINDTNYTKGRLMRSFSVSLLDATGGIIVNTSQNCTAIIVDDDPKIGRILFVDSAHTIDESSGLAVIQATRVDGDDTDIYLRFVTSAANIWDSVTDQTFHSLAYPWYLSDQSYACYSTLDGIVTADLPGANALFDFNVSTFWDSDVLPTFTQQLTYSFSRCELAGNSIASYTFFTDNGIESSCPKSWALQGSIDEIIWADLHDVSDATCSPNGRTYLLVSPSTNLYKAYRWIFKMDTLGANRVKLSEVSFQFNTSSDSMLQATMCNRSGSCCQFQGASCDPISGYYFALRNTTYDYEYTVSMLHWKESESGVKNFSIPVISDQLGCVVSTCANTDQLQDRPYENFAARMSNVLAVSSLTEIIPWSTATVTDGILFPFQKFPPLDMNSPNIWIKDDDGPGVLSLYALSCDTKSGYTVPSFVSSAGYVIAGNDAKCPVLHSIGVMWFKVTRSGRGRGTVSATFSAANITAIPREDYEPVNGTLTWPHGDTAAKFFSVKINPSEGYKIGGYSKSINVSLGHVQGGAALSECERYVDQICVEPPKSSFIVTIVEQASAYGAIKIQDSELSPPDQYQADLQDGNVTIYLMRVNGSNLPINVSYATELRSDDPDFDSAVPCEGEPGSQQNSDCQYWPVDGTIRWEDGDADVKEVRVPLNQMSMLRQIKTFGFRVWGNLNTTLEFCGGYGPATSGSKVNVFQSFACDVSFGDVATVSVAFRDGGNLGLVASAWPYVVTEGNNVVLSIERTKYFTGTVVLDFETYGGSAVPSKNYVATQNQLKWLDGDTSTRTISINTLRALPVAGAVDFMVQLAVSSPNSLIIRDQREVRVVIHGNAGIYAPQFMTCSVAEATSAQQNLNTISFAFTINAVAGPGATLTVSGLKDSQTPSTPVLPVGGPSAGIFDSVGAWDQLQGILVLNVSKTLNFFVDYQFQIILRNPPTRVRSKLAVMTIIGTPTCNQDAGNGFSCPQAVNIDSRKTPSLAIASVFILEGFAQSFLPLSATSHMCPYDECPHSTVFNALNYIRIAYQPTLPIPQLSEFTVSGLLGGMQPSSSNITVRLKNVVGTPFRAKSLTAICKCSWQDCGCAHTFDGIPQVSAVTLRIQIQCNYLGRALQEVGDDAIVVRVGFDKSYTLSTGLNYNITCLDQCAYYHDLFVPLLNVSDMISDTGLLFVSISTIASVDFCEDGEFLNTNMTLSWLTETSDLIDVNASWNRNDGILDFLLPAGYSISTSYISYIQFSIFNPSSFNNGSTISLAVKSSDNKFYGPTNVEGAILMADRSPAVTFSNIQEINPVKGATNYIVFEILFNSDVGGSSDGLWVNISGLKNSQTPDNPKLPVMDCFFCNTSVLPVFGNPISSFVGDILNRTDGTASWTEDGELTFYLRGSPPTYRIPQQPLVGVIKLTNSDTTQVGDFDIVLSIGGNAVQGSANYSQVFMYVGGYGNDASILKAQSSTAMFQNVALQSSNPTAFMPPGTIILSFDLLQSLQYKDVIVVHAPSLTTCAALCDNIPCSYKQDTCQDIKAGVLHSNATAPSSLISATSGFETHAFLFSWNQSRNEMSLLVFGGRALLPGARIQALIQPTDYGCNDYSCALKLLPNKALASNVASINSAISGCSPTSLVCTAYEFDFTAEKFDPQPGAYWAQASLVEDSNGGSAYGRVWFSAQVHQQKLFILGGMSSQSYANYTFSTSDGYNWDRVPWSEWNAIGRTFFPSTTFNHFIWVYGGRTNSPYGLMNDVWKSLDGENWCIATQQAPWSARWNHAAVIHADRMWILGGTSEAKQEQDVWYSSNGVLWHRAIDNAAFLPRNRFSAASFKSRIWVYGGTLSSSDVWFSYDGSVWSQATVSAPWTKTQLHSGLVYFDRLWAVGSSRDTDDRDVWYSTDGVLWQQATSAALFGRRHGFEAVKFRNRMWIVGGSTEPCDDIGLQACPSTYVSDNCSITEYDGYFTSCKLNDIWLSPFSDAEFLRLEINSSTAVFGADDQVHVLGILDQDMNVGSMLIISGLDQAQQTTQDDRLVIISVTGRSSDAFERVGVWNREEGTAIFVFQSRVPALEEISFSFVVKNIEFERPLKKVNMIAFSNSFDASSGSSWHYRSTVEMPDPAQNLSTLSSFLHYDDLPPSADIQVKVIFNSVWNSYNFTLEDCAQNAGCVPHSIANDSAFAEFLFNYSVNLQESLNGTPAQIVSYCRNTTCFDCLASSSVVDFTDGCDPRPLIPREDQENSVTFRFADVQEMGIADTIMSNAGCIFEVNLNKSSNIWYTGEVQRFVLSVTNCPLGFVNTSEVLVCSESPRIFNGGIMFDVDVLSSLSVTSFELEIPVTINSQMLSPQVYLYHRIGSHLDSRVRDNLDDRGKRGSGAVYNLSEWRLIGRVAMPMPFEEDVFKFNVEDLQSRSGAERTGICTAETAFSCQAGVTAEVDEWLGQQPSWARDEEAFMSSKFNDAVNITGVITQSNTSFWHSGGAPLTINSAENETDCPNLPICEPSWPYDKNQWLAFDLQVCFSLSRFRTFFPSFVLVPDYKFLGVSRQDRNFTNATRKQEWWNRAHFKNFEFQYSISGLNGPWTTVLSGTADQQSTGWQEFSFQPTTARFWRLLMLDNYGFGYSALGAIEFYGSLSIWCQNSIWCANSILCRPEDSDLMSTVWQPDAGMRPNGLVLSSGLHSFYVRTTLGAGVAAYPSKGRRGEIVASDDQLAVKLGTSVEFNAPFWAWELRADKTSMLDLNNLVENYMQGRNDFTLLVNFATPDLNITGTLLSLGDVCNGGMNLIMSQSGLQLLQGCAGSTVQSSSTISLLHSQNYCYTASFFGGKIQHRLERLSRYSLQPPIILNETVSMTIPAFSNVNVGASGPCNSGIFTGNVLGISLYGEHLSEDDLLPACRRQCKAVSSDGSCLDAASLELEQQILTAGAADVKYMELPAPSLACFKEFRFQVEVSSNNLQWCVQEIAMFQTNAPYWQDLRTAGGNATFTVSCSSPNWQLCKLAFDGKADIDGSITAGSSEPFCSGTGNRRGWISIKFGNSSSSSTCISGYSLLSPDNMTSRGLPSTWTLQGSNDGLVWNLIDNQSGVSWQRNRWRRFEANSRVQPYLFFPNFYNSSITFGYNTNSRLYRWIGENENQGWVLAQELVTRGARRAEHFVIDGEHYLAVAGVRDSTVVAEARTNDGRVTDTYVGSDIFKWTGAEFVAFDTLFTNNSLDIKYFEVDGRHFLISADQRIVPGNRDPAHLNGTIGQTHSILFERTVNLSSCLDEVCLENNVCPCKSCMCSTMLNGVANSSIPSDHDHPPQDAFDGDSLTFWRGYFGELPTNTSLPPFLLQNVSLQWEFRNCSRGAFVAAYSVMTTEKLCPEAWWFEASMDGVAWILLDQQFGRTCRNITLPETFVFTPLYDQRFTTGTKYATNIIPYRFYRMVFPRPLLRSSNTYRELAIEISDVEFIFLNSGNAALIAVYLPWTVTAFDFSAFDAPYSSINRDSDGFPVPGLIQTGFDHNGPFNTFDVELVSGSTLSKDLNCYFSPAYSPGELWNVSVAPFFSCTSAWDLCGSSQPVCFAGTPYHGTRTQKYLYKITFKTNVRLLTLRMRGCGWCRGNVTVWNQDLVPLAIRDHPMRDCRSCASWMLKVNATGRVFYVSEENSAPWSLRAAISFEYELHSEWQETQLLPTQGAADFEFFSVSNASFLVVANYRSWEECYGDIECVNPENASPLQTNSTLPYAINSSIFRYNANGTVGQWFTLFQQIPTKGAMDWEHFEILDRHYLVVANSFDAQLSTPATESQIYLWNSSMQMFTLFQEIPTFGAKCWKYFEKDGDPFLIVANALQNDIALMNCALYRWTGSAFVYAGNIYTPAASGIAIYNFNQALYVAISNFYGAGEDFTTNSTVFRWHDAFKFRGSIQYSDIFSSSSAFINRSIETNSTLADAVSILNVTLQSNVDILNNSIITIGGLLGSQTESGVISIDGLGAGYFAFVGLWNRDGGTLVLNVSQNISAKTNVSFSFGLITGTQIAASVGPYVSCSGVVEITPSNMTGLVLGVASLPPPMFTNAIISESSSMQLQPANIISVTLRANRDIVNGTLLKIINLVGAVHSSPNVSVTGSSTSFFAPIATWNISGGVILTVVSAVPAYRTFSFNFTVGNGRVPQVAVNPSALASYPNGTSFVPQVDFHGLILSFREPPSFIIAIIQGSNNIAGSSNTFFVTLQPGLPLLTGATFSISGLVQPQMKDGDAVQVFGGLLDMQRIRATKGIFSASRFGFSVDTIVFQVNDTMPMDALTVFSFTLVNYISRTNPSQPVISITSCLTQDQPGEGTLASSTTCEIAPRAMTSGSPGYLVLSSGINISVLNLPPAAKALSYQDYPFTSISEFSVEMWVMVTSNFTGSVNEKKSFLSLGSAVAVGFLGNNPGSSLTFNISSSLQIGQWFHVCGTWSSDTGNATIYLNGAFSTYQFGVLAKQMLQLRGPLTVGSGETTYGLSVAQIRMWSIALREQDILWTANSISLGKRFLSRYYIPEALLVYYTFESAGNDSSVVRQDLNVSSYKITATFPSQAMGMNEYVYPTVTLRNVLLSSSSKMPGGDNCINITFTSNVTLGPRAKFFIYGLTGTQTYVPWIYVYSAGALHQLFSGGFWDFQSGLMTLSLDYPLPKDTPVSLSFSLINNQMEQAAQNISMAIQDGTIWSYGSIPNTVGEVTLGTALESNRSYLLPGCVYTDTVIESSGWLKGICESSTGWPSQPCPTFGTISWLNSSFTRPCDCAPACPTATFKASMCMKNPTDKWRTRMQVQDSSDIPNSANKLSFSLQPDRKLPAGSFVRIWGLTGTLTSSASANASCLITESCFLSLSGPNALSFALDYGIWNQSVGNLTLRLQDAMNSTGDFVFSILLQNGIYQQDFVIPHIDVVGMVKVPPTKMCGQVLKIPAITLSSELFSESSCAKCKLNNIHIVLAINVHLPNGTTFSIQNLSGSLMPSGIIPLTGIDSYKLESTNGSAGTAHWNADTQTLRFMSRAVLNQQDVLDFSFTIQNGFMERAPITPIITVQTLNSTFWSEFTGSGLSFQLPLAQNESDEVNWIGTGWFVHSFWQTTVVEVLKKAVGVCCIGQCCPAFSCCTCVDLFASGLPQYQPTGTYFPGSACETFCDRRIYSFGGSDSSGLSNILIADEPGTDIWATVVPTSSSSEAVQFALADGSTYMARKAAFGLPFSADAEQWGGSLVLANPQDACSPLQNAASMAGNIAVVQRGSCDFTVKLRNAQYAGALAAIVYNNISAQGPFTMLGYADDIGIPALMVSKQNGTALITAIGSGTQVITFPMFTNTEGSRPPSSRFGHSMSSAYKRLYVFGGSSGINATSCSSSTGGTLKDFWIFSPESMTWTEITDPNGPTGRCGHSAVISAVAALEASESSFVFGGRIPQQTLVMFGGIDVNGLVLNDMWIFDPIRAEWLNGTSSYVTSVVEWLNSTSSSMADIFDLGPSRPPLERWGHAAVTIGKHVYVMGGKSANGTVLGDIWTFDVDQTGMQSSSLQDLTLHDYLQQCTVHEECRYPTPRYGHAAAAVALPATNDERRFAHERIYMLQEVYVYRVFVFGGVDQHGTVLQELWSFDPIKVVWAELTSQYAAGSPPARWGHTAMSARNVLYISGGLGSDNATLGDTWTYDPRTSQWNNSTSSTPLFGQASVAAADWQHPVWTLVTQRQNDTFF